MNFSYIIKESLRAKNLRLTVNRLGEVVVTKPKRVSLRFVENFVLKNKEWVIRCLGKVTGEKSERLPVPEKKDFLANRYQFQSRIREKIERINKLYSFKYGLVSVNNAKTRLGSCSRSGRLNFSYRLSVYPDDIIDYVVAHELCHLKEFNHSRSFWDLVALAIPDYRQKRRIMKKL
jgi:predicted metal-dependent hydrolase